jgi:allophanate hydrolase
MHELAFDIASLHRAYAGGLTVDRLIDEVLRRIAVANDAGIFIHLASREELHAEAGRLGAFDPLLKPLWGIPFAVKDNIDVAFMQTTAGCPAYAYRPAADATVVALLRQAGAIVIGKTNLDQFATGLVGLRTPYPAPRNAVDAALVPGGSSSGSAVAVARGIVSFALGTDTAGSGRVPAVLNNIVGLKPSFGAISATGVVPACRTLDCVSVFALTVDDAYEVASVAAKPDAADPYSRAMPFRPLAPRPPVLSVGVPAKSERKFFGDAAMQVGFEAALAQLEALNCKLVELPFAAFYATADLLYEGAWVAERYAAIKAFMEANEEAMHPVTRALIGGARKLSAADAFAGLYELKALQAQLAPLIASIDLICVPTAPRHYRVEEVLAEPILTNSRLGTYTNFVNLLDLCGIAVPAGSRADGLPMSVTLLAPAGGDAKAAALASELHEAVATTLGATSWRHPGARNRAAAVVKDDTIDIAVVGLHLSGMPLNGELRALGAAFSRAARTTASYRLYALGGGRPQKPGLLRTEAGRGAPIELEIWRLPPAAFGRFVAAIPPPLGIGTIALEDGSACKGFLVEPIALEGATDITAHGGWRAYLAAAETQARGR